MEKKDNKLIGILVIGGLIWWLYRKKTTGITITPAPEVVKEVPPAELPPSMQPEPKQQIQPPSMQPLQSAKEEFKLFPPLLILLGQFCCNLPKRNLN